MSEQSKENKVRKLNRKPYNTRIMKQGVTIRDEFGKRRGVFCSDNYLEISLASHYLRFILGYDDRVIVELSAKQLGHEVLEKESNKV